MSKFQINDLVRVADVGEGVIIGEGADACDTLWGYIPKLWEIRFADGAVDWAEECEITPTNGCPGWWDDNGLPFCDVT